MNRKMEAALNKTFRTNFRSRNTKHSLEILIEVVLGLLFILSLTIFLLLSLPIYLFRIFVIVYAKFFREDLDEILNGISAYMVNDYFDNKTPRANQVAQLIIRGTMTIEELKQLIKRRWIEANDDRFKKFRQYPIRWMGFTFYKRAAASPHIDNHVYLYPKLEQTNATHVTEEDVLIYSEKLLNSPYAPFKSPWEVHLIQNYKNETICPDSEQLNVLIFKVHHSLTDGFGIISAFVQAFSQQDLADIKIPKPRYEKRTWWDKLTRLFILSIRMVTEIGQFVFQSLQSNPWKVPDGKKEWYQLSFQSKLIPIQKFQKIRNTLGVSFSSVLYSAISAGIKKSMHKTKQTTENIMFENFKDTSIYCLQVLPLPDHPMSLTNHLNSIFLDLPVLEYDNPIERIQDIDLVLRSARETSCVPWIFPWLTYVFGSHVYPIIKLIFRNRTFPMGITNFPAEPFRFEINGKQVCATGAITGALDGVAGVDVLMLSYGQYITVSVSAEKALMDKEDINQFGKYIVDEIETLYLTACSTP